MSSVRLLCGLVFRQVAVLAGCVLLLLLAFPVQGEETAQAKADRYLELVNTVQAEADGYFQAAHGFTRGVDFSVATCEKAQPLLENAVAAWQKLPASERRDNFPRLQLGRCQLSRQDYASAARSFQSILDQARQTYEPQFEDRARLHLADLYARGQGVEKNLEHALALYLLVSPPEPNLQKHRNRAAAEIVFTLNAQLSSEFFYQLLETGAPANWARAWHQHLAESRHGDSYDAAPLAIKALGPVLMEYDEADDQAAARALSLEAGKSLLGRGGGMYGPAALAYLLHADPLKAAPYLAQWEKELPYRLTLPNGQAWEPRYVHP